MSTPSNDAASYAQNIVPEPSQSPSYRTPLALDEQSISFVIDKRTGDKCILYSVTNLVRHPEGRSLDSNRETKSFGTFAESLDTDVRVVSSVLLLRKGTVVKP